MRNDKIDESIESLKHRYGRPYALKFTDESTWPFGGEHIGKRLKHISPDFWKIFVEEHDFLPKEGFANRGSQYQTVVGKLLAYAKKRVYAHKRAVEKANYVAPCKGRIWINNGRKNRMIFPDDPMPVGYSKGGIFKSRNKSVSKEARSKISQKLKEYYKTEKGIKHKEKMAKLRREGK